MIEYIIIGLLIVLVGFEKYVHLQDVKRLTNLISLKETGHTLDEHGKAVDKVGEVLEDLLHDPLNAENADPDKFLKALKSDLEAEDAGVAVIPKPEKPNSDDSMQE